jgi:hypothetical protein
MGNVSTLERVDIEGLVDFTASEAAVFGDLNAKLETERFDQPELPFEQEVARRTEKLLGRIALVGTSEAKQLQEATVTLAEALQRARKGDKEAYKLVYNNVATDYLERTYKSGHVIRIELGKDKKGQLLQHGQTMDEVFINSLQHLKNRALLERAKIEAHNGQRIQHYYERGLLKDNFLVMHSRVPDTITPAEAKKLGFFTETMSCAIQVVTEEDGKVVVYSAFVAGADEGGERFDGTVVAYSAASRGSNYYGLNADEVLATPELVAKVQAPKGVLTFVEKYDEPTGRFFGRKHTGPKDYEGHLKECQRREERAKELITSVVDKLISEAPELKSPTTATKRLDQLNDQLLKKVILCDKSIDSNVLGAKVSGNVKRARQHFDRGDYAAMEYELRIAQTFGRSNSCPTGADEKENTELQEDSKSTNEDCDFISKECPKCGAKNVYTKCRNGKYYGSCGCVG